MATKEYTNAINLTEDMWENSSYKHKEKLLREMGLDKSWANTKSVKEMVSRGGGTPANEILKLNREYLKRNEGKVKINWN